MGYLRRNAVPRTSHRPETETGTTKLLSSRVGMHPEYTDHQLFENPLGSYSLIFGLRRLLVELMLHWMTRVLEPL